jgi:ubiquinone/menaquinone biosynthesis C-methylase UbiE
MHKDDEAQFRRFAAIAKSLGRSLEQHYALQQAEQRDRAGAALELGRHEQRGMQMALRHLTPGQSILVMGCGAGAEIGFLKAAGFNNLTGIDISPRLAAQAGQRHLVATVAGDMARTGLPDRSFDCVLVHRALHHLFYPFAALEEMARLARQAVLVVNEPARAAAKIALRFLRRAPVLGSDGVYEYQFDPADVARYLGFSGLAPLFIKRYWETGHPTADRLANFALQSAGNRFIAVFQRLKVVV